MNAVYVSAQTVSISDRESLVRFKRQKYAIHCGNKHSLMSFLLIIRTHIDHNIVIVLLGIKNAPRGNDNKRDADIREIGLLLFWVRAGKYHSILTLCYAFLRIVGVVRCECFITLTSLRRTVICNKLDSNINLCTCCFISHCFSLNIYIFIFNKSST